MSHTAKMSPGEPNLAAYLFLLKIELRDFRGIQLNARMSPSVCSGEVTSQENWEAKRHTFRLVDIHIQKALSRKMDCHAPGVERTLVKRAGTLVLAQALPP